MSRLYVAYGSNLDKAQMARRCLDAKVYGVGKLNGWEMLFHGSKTGSYATIARRPGCHVPVAVWEISERDERNLDRYEGFPTFYQKHNVMVEMASEGGKKKKCMVYIMTPGTAPGEPTRTYVETIRRGYRYFGFSERVLQEALARNRKEIDDAEVKVRPWMRRF